MSVLRCWRDQAACRDVVTGDYDPFFADTKAEQLEALAICANCQVRDDCLTFAVRSGQRYGIWGGQPQPMVRRLIALDRAVQPRGRSAPAGHPRAGRTHCKHGHRLDLENTYYTLDGQRRCRTCLREAQPAWGLEGGGSDAA
jgi:WhiB family transcriptional regulator, redox-sensing transcriptional regulator